MSFPEKGWKNKPSENLHRCSLFRTFAAINRMTVRDMDNMLATYGTVDLSVKGCGGVACGAYPPPINYLIIKRLAARGAAIGRLLALPPWHMLCALWVMPFLYA